MSPGNAFALIGVAATAGLVMFLMSIALITLLRGRLPGIGDVVLVLAFTGAVMLVVIGDLMPDMPPPPAGVVPTTYGPPPDVPRDVLSGEPL